MKTIFLMIILIKLHIYHHLFNLFKSNHISIKKSMILYCTYIVVFQIVISDAFLKYLKYYNLYSLSMNDNITQG